MNGALGRIQGLCASKRRIRIESFTCTNQTVDAQGVYVHCMRRGRNVATVTFLNFVPNG